MKPLFVIPASAIVAAATALVVLELRGRDSAPRAPAAAPATGDIARLEQSLERLETRTTELARALDELRLATPNAASSPRVSVGEIEAAVSRAVEARGARTPEGASAGTQKPKTLVDARAALAKLDQTGGTWGEREACWKEIREAGLLDEVVALLEARAKERANDPRAQVEVGKAYIQKVQTASDGPERGTWATKADRAFDAALALDDHDWDARFNKAISLSFWPPIFGKQNEAIRHFELLAGQQSGQPARDGFAETHLWLGNLYQQSGKTEKALAAWQQGLVLFPDNEALKGQIAAAQGH